MSREANNPIYNRSRPDQRREARPRPAAQRLQRDTSRLDEKVQQLLTKLPSAPYLVSVPSDVPYRHHSRFISIWHRGTPFFPDEEALQYLSYVPQTQGAYRTLMKTVGGWSDEQGNFVEEDPSPSQAFDSVTASPAGSQRKKITLSDYKSKAKGEEAGKTDDMGRGDRRKSDESVPQTNKKPEMTTNRQSVPQEHIKEPKEKKRSFDSVADHTSQTKSPKPEKRPRTKSPPPSAPPRNSENLASTRVPSLVSPTLPPSKEALTIPPLISPTLPPLLLDDSEPESEPVPTREHQGHREHQRTDSVRSILSAAPLGSSPLSASQRSGVARNNHERHLSPSLQLERRDPRSSPGARSRDPTSSPGARQRRTIVLKYGKKNRKRVEAILRLPPRKPKAKPPVKESTSREEGSREKKSSQDLMPASEKSRVRSSSSSELPQRRPKVPPSLNLVERPTTPVPAAFKSPGLHNHSQPRSAFTTPKRDLKTTAMRRVESSEGVDARTPMGNVTRQGTPGSVDRSQSSMRPSSPFDPTSSILNRDENRREWLSLVPKYFDLGRKIKREAQGLNKPNDSMGNKRGALLAIEALLCFMLNQAITCTAKNSSEGQWSSILPYLDYVRNFTKPFPQLYGLTAQLGAVCRQIIARHDMERLKREPLPEDLNGAASAPTPGSDGITKPSEDADKARKKWLAFRAELTDNAEKLQRAWLEGSQSLGPDLLRRHFSKTWAQRAKDSSARTGPGEKSTMADNFLAGPGPADGCLKYFLPLDSNTGPFEAVRYALDVLVEWADSEGEDKWEPKIGS